jgi:hypothetical protein
MLFSFKDHALNTDYSSVLNYMFLLPSIISGISLSASSPRFNQHGFNHFQKFHSVYTESYCVNGLSLSFYSCLQLKCRLLRKESARPRIRDALTRDLDKLIVAVVAIWHWQSAKHPSSIVPCNTSSMTTTDTTELLTAPLPFQVTKHCSRLGARSETAIIDAGQRSSS